MTEKTNIFVTVGSTDFDALIKTVDELSKTLNLHGLMQIGHGTYIPTNFPYFRFSQSLKQYYQQADLIIAHGGLATTIEILTSGIPLISVSNHDRYDNHQDDLLSAFSEEGYLLWCQNIKYLNQAITTCQKITLKRYPKPSCTIHTIINKFLLSLR